MNIDRYKREDGTYLDEAGCTYEDAGDLLQTHVFGFCGCGMPDENIYFVRDGLQHIDNLSKCFEDQANKDAAYDKWSERTLEIFGSNRGAYFFYYWCDNKLLVEHGGGLPGWLTDKGKELLADLCEYIASLPPEDEP